MTDEQIDDILDGKYGDEIVFVEGGMFIIPKETAEAIRNNPPKPNTLFGLPLKGLNNGLR